MSTIEDSNFIIMDVTPNEREELVEILKESFEGWYLRHATRTLFNTKVVRQAKVKGQRAGLVMLKDLGNKLGYVYYIAVPEKFRGKGIGGKLLDYSLSFFFDLGMHEVYASIEEDNTESNRLFSSRGFKRTTRGELAKKYGTLNSFVLLRKMVIVPGEMILFKELSPALDSNSS